MIAEQYINEGARLRKSYLENLKEILNQEPFINSRKNTFEKLKGEMESLVFSDVNDIRKTMELNNKLIILEKEIKNIQDIIKPFYDKIESIKTEGDRLYSSIKEKYPNITDEQIRKEIMLKYE
jgi:RecG-like helicase